MNVAIIPARGGSKRIPRKNVREFAGKPMIAYSIECSLQSGLFEQVIPVHLQPYCPRLGFRPGDFPQAEHHSREAITLPLIPDGEQDAVVAALTREVERA